MHQRTGAHCARFNGNKQLTGSQTVVTYRSTSFAQRKDLRMSTRVGVGDVPVPSAPNNLSVAHDYSTDGDLPGFQSALRRAHSLLHPEFIRSSCRLLAAGS